MQIYYKFCSGANGNFLSGLKIFSRANRDQLRHILSYAKMKKLIQVQKSKISHIQMQVQTKYASLYTLKQKAAAHINSKKFSWATVYLIDSLKQFQSIVEQVEDEQTMEKLIRDIKLAGHKNLSLCYLKQNNYGECIGHCLKVLEIEPNCIKILYRIGISYMEMSEHKLDEAQKYLKRAFLLDPTQKQVMRALQKIQQKKNQMKNLSKIKEERMSKFSLVELIKLLFIWPFIVLSLVYNKMKGEKKKNL